MTKNNPDKLCKECRKFDRAINGTGGACNDVWVECKCEDDEMTWISVKERPEAYVDILLTDGERQWVGYTFDNLDIYLASHPDYNREPKNEYGAPFVTYAKPTHWMHLTQPPKDENGFK